MPLLAAVTSTEFPLLNVRLDTVADDQPDSNCPAAWPEAASSTPLCFNEVMSPLVPLIVKTTPEPVSNVTFAAAAATWGAAPTKASATATTTGPTHRRRPGRSTGRRPGSGACGSMGDPDLVRPSHRTPKHRRASTTVGTGSDVDPLARGPNKVSRPAWRPAPEPSANDCPGWTDAEPPLPAFLPPPRPAGERCAVTGVPGSANRPDGATLPRPPHQPRARQRYDVDVLRACRRHASPPDDHVGRSPSSARCAMSREVTRA